jgi:hypothetical protein
MPRLNFVACRMLLGRALLPVDWLLAQLLLGWMSAVAGHLQSR